MSDSAGSAGAPLQGFLATESGEEVTVRVPHGKWVIKRDDVLELSDWPDPVKAEVEGRPVQVITKPGAVLDFVQSVRVEQTDRPMTLSERRLSDIVGREQLTQMGKAWAGRLGFKVVDAGAGSSPSACCWETGEWGIDCSPDDSMD